MPIELRVARRYFWFARRRMHTAMLAVISMLGLAIGVFALIFSIALLSGFQEQIKDRLIASSPQLLIEPGGSVTLSGSEAIVAAARRTRLTPFGPMPVWRKYRIAQLRAAGTDERAADAYLSLSETERLFGTNGQPTAIETWGDAERAEPLQRTLQGLFPSVQVKT